MSAFSSRPRTLLFISSITVYKGSFTIRKRKKNIFTSRLTDKIERNDNNPRSYCLRGQFFLRNLAVHSYITAMTTFLSDLEICRIHSILTKIDSKLRHCYVDTFQEPPLKPINFFQILLIEEMRTTNYRHPSSFRNFSY